MSPQTATPAEVFGTPSARRLVFLFLALALLIVAGVRVRLLDLPLERDEGEYAYAGQLILEGIPPYQLAYNMKMPGTYVAYALTMAVFGQTPTGIHLGLLVVHLATIAVLFLIARTFLDLPGAALGTASFALMTLSSAYTGLAAHATHFVLLPALLGVWSLLRSDSSAQRFWCLISGCFFGIAFVMKQHGVFFGLFGGLYLGWTSLAQKMAWRQAVARLGLYAIGCLLPFFAVCFWLKVAGVFSNFWFWTISYAREYVTMVPFSEGVEHAEFRLTKIFLAAPILILFAVIGFGCLCFMRLPVKTRVFLGGLFVFSFLAVCPGNYFRGQYFILFVPAVALLTGLAVSCAGHWLAKSALAPGWRFVPILLAAIACVQSLYQDRELLFTLSPTDASRLMYGDNPFPESIDIAKYIRDNSRADQRIAVLGSEPQIYFYAHRHSSTGYIYTYPLMEPQPFAERMQREMIREIEQNPPAYLVLVSMPVSWLPSTNSCRLLFDWGPDYVKEKMQPVGLIQFIDRQTRDTVWGPDAATTPLRARYFITVYQAKTNSPVSVK